MQPTFLAFSMCPCSARELGDSGRMMPADQDDEARNSCTHHESNHVLITTCIEAALATAAFGLLHTLSCRMLEGTPELGIRGT